MGRSVVARAVWPSADRVWVAEHPDQTLLRRELESAAQAGFSGLVRLVADERDVEAAAAEQPADVVEAGLDLAALPAGDRLPGNADPLRQPLLGEPNQQPRLADHLAGPHEPGVYSARRSCSVRRIRY